MKPPKPKARTAPPPAGTRERVVRLTHDLIRERGNAAVSLVEIAAKADLSRQMLYVLFGSRAGLLMAVVDHLDQTSAGPARLAALRRKGEPNFEPYVRAWFDYLPVVLPVALALSAAAKSGDEDARLAWESRMQKLHHGFAQLTAALKAAGRLKPGWTPTTAADWMFALTHVELWQHLVVDAGWKPQAHIERIVSVLRQTLLT